MDENFADKLDGIFKIINEWLKFAEQKNAALLILNCGLTWGIARVLAKQENLSSIANCLNSFGYMFIIASAITCLISFIPILEIPWFKVGGKNNSDNCVFFGHIAKYTNREYLTLLSKKLGAVRQNFNDFELDVASQIVTNSEIALNKYKQFTFSSWLTILGVISFGVSMLTKFIG
ncbi:MAG: hypothetical protein ACJAT7_003751 [Psychromonas sp.]|uniref:Pycsar system effector family protein n=1 Tax=Psychromonas sp. TaxID=1884585 RepID=UPI0039E2DB5E